MDQHVDLLPSSAHRFERALSAAMDPTEELAPAIEAIRAVKTLHPPPSFMPYLIWEYGLGILTPYLPNLYDLYQEGRDWLEIRGTHGAVDLALSWLSYAGEIEPAATRRLWWNAYHLALDRVRDDEADLIRIEGLTTLSKERHSDFWRGLCGYDVRPAESDRRRHDGAMWDDSSGVVLPPGKVKWSFGRRTDIVHDVSQDDRDALGIPRPNGLTMDGEPIVFDGEPLTVGDDAVELSWGDFTWGDFAWSSDVAGVEANSALLATGPGPAWAVFKDLAGEVIGYRRCRVRRAVEPDPAGRYRVGADGFRPAPGLASSLYLEAMTDFGDGEGATAQSVGFVLTATPLAPFKPGQLWLPPGGIDPDLPVIAEHVVPIAFGHTVRERVVALLRF